MSKVDPRDFLLNTDYEQDKIVLYLDGMMQPGTTQDIMHQLPFTPLLFGVCAYNEDFSDSKSVPFNDKVSMAGTPPIETSAISFDALAYNNEPKITLTYNNTEDANQALYFRLYAFQPSDSTAPAPITSRHAKSFLLNTDYNYCKLYKKGIIDGNSDTIITHNFGYIPQVLAWLEVGSFGNYIMPIYFNTLGDDSGTYVPTGIEVTDTQILFKYANNWVPDCKIHYRVYYDEA